MQNTLVSVDLIIEFYSACLYVSQYDLKQFTSTLFRNIGISDTILRLTKIAEGCFRCKDEQWPLDLKVSSFDGQRSYAKCVCVRERERKKDTPLSGFIVIEIEIVRLLRERGRKVRTCAISGGVEETRQRQKQRRERGGETTSYPWGRLQPS